MLSKTKCNTCDGSGLNGALVVGEQQEHLHPHLKGKVGACPTCGGSGVEPVLSRQRIKEAADAAAVVGDGS